MIRQLFTFAAVFLIACQVIAVEVALDAITLVVMDPLSKPLSCDCVKGYAQRDYQLLADYLKVKLGRQVDVVWNASLVQGMKDTKGKCDLVIGKHSVILHDAKSLNLVFEPIARLTGTNGDVNQHGLIVVPKKDAAQSVNDLSGYRLLLGGKEAEEKSGAALRLLEQHGVSVPQQHQEVFAACSEAATRLLKLPAGTRAAAVISSYAEPLLEGCGSINKGDLRVIGKTESLPFITAFVPETLESSLKEQVVESLELVGTDATLLAGLETLDGFVPWKDDSTAKKK